MSWLDEKNFKTNTVTEVFSAIGIIVFLSAIVLFGLFL